MDVNDESYIVSNVTYVMHVFNVKQNLLVLEIDVALKYE